MSNERVLLVDDDPSVLSITKRLLERRGYSVRSTNSAVDGLTILNNDTFDLLLADIHMPQMTGLELVKEARTLVPDLTCVMITGSNTLKMAIQALKSGAQGFVCKPFTEGELYESIDLALEKTRLVRENVYMRIYAPLLESACTALLNALAAKDPDTQEHCQRLAQSAHNLAFDLGLPPEAAVRVRIAALFHDIGKIGVPDAVLNKPSSLTDDERYQIMRHPDIGHNIINAVQGLGDVADMVRAHHERYDGNGYPSHLAGEEIPYGARIITVADSFDAMIFRRVYSNGRPIKTALDELRRGKGTQFDPHIVDVFAERVEQDFERIEAERNEYFRRYEARPPRWAQMPVGINGDSSTADPLDTCDPSWYTLAAPAASVFAAQTLTNRS